MKDRKRKEGLGQKEAGMEGEMQTESSRQEAPCDNKGLEELKRRLEEKDKEAKENYERMLRMAADLDNYKKRASREKEDWTKFANEEFIKAILPFIDNLERAINHSEKTKDLQGFVEGLQLTIQQLLQTLSRFGVSAIESVGKPFDPAFHEAMMVVETADHEPNQVVQEFQKGYLLKDRLLRPASVSVSKLKEKKAEVQT